MNLEITAEIEHYNENMRWDRITIQGFRDALEDIISQYHRNAFLSPRQIATLRKTCLWSNTQDAESETVDQ